MFVVVLGVLPTKPAKEATEETYNTSTKNTVYVLQRRAAAVKAMPAPISRNPPARSYTRTEMFCRSSPSVSIAPTMPPPTMATRGSAVLEIPSPAMVKNCMCRGLDVYAVGRRVSANCQDSVKWMR